MSKRLLLGILAVTCLFQRAPGAQTSERAPWVGTWSAAMTWRPAAGPAVTTTPPVVPQTPNAPPAAPGAPPGLQFRDQTIRNTIRTTIGGNRLRVVLSN